MANWRSADRGYHAYLVRHFTMAGSTRSACWLYEVYERDPTEEETNERQNQIPLL